jgi:hypothetical protein
MQASAVQLCRSPTTLHRTPAQTAGPLVGEHPTLAGGGQGWIEHRSTVEHHVLEPVNAGLHTLGSLLGGGDMGEDAPPLTSAFEVA